MDSGVLAVVVAASSPAEWHGKAILFDAPEGLQRGDFDGVVDAYLQAKVRSCVGPVCVCARDAMCVGVVDSLCSGA